MRHCSRPGVACLQNVASAAGLEKDGGLVKLLRRLVLATEDDEDVMGALFSLLARLPEAARALLKVLHLLGDSISRLTK